MVSNREVLVKMLVFLTSIFVIPTAAQFDIPQAPNGYVLDQAGILNAQTQQALEEQFTQLETDTTTQIAVLTVDSLQGRTIEEFAIETARDWGVGQKDVNNGVLVLIAPNDREVRIEVGYGLEGALTDAQSSAIINSIMIPYFKTGDYDTAVLQAANILDNIARGEEFVFPEQPQGPRIFALIVILINFGWILISIFTGSKSWWLGGVFGGIIGAFILVWEGILIGVIIGLIVDYFLSKYFYKKINWTTGGSGRSGRGGYGSGGFGGFGGGGFGGGGASGRW